MTILRTIIWFVFAIVAMLGAVWLAERPGSVTAEFRGWRLDTSVGVLMVSVLVLILVSVGGWLLYRWIVGAPGALLDGWGESRRRRGYRELTQGLAAVAAGDGVEAQKHARKAEQLLSEPALTLLLSAQAAQLNGDRDGARRAFTAMLDDDQMAFLGLRGLIGQSLRDGDQAQALAHAERAFRLRPQTPWVVHSLFDMQAQVGHWRAAQETLETGIRRKVVTADKGRTLKALLEVERSREAEREGRPSDALALARDAFALAPERIAVTRRLAELQLEAGESKKAMKTIERGWALAPHPDLASLYLEASGETEALKRIAVARRLGSLPKPAWLAETQKLWPQVEGRGRRAAQAKADATLLWIKAQEDAGLDIVGDGEQSRQHFVHGFLEQVEGIDFEHKVKMGIRNNRYDAMVPQVVAPLR
jgi:HemY protein